MSYPLPATRRSLDGEGLEVTATGVQIICEHLKRAIDARLDTLRCLSGPDHCQARGHLRNLLDLVDALEHRHGIR
jgi:hypothetical protein